MRYILIMLVLLSPSFAKGEVTWGPTPSDALALALADAKAHPERAPGTTYFFNLYGQNLNTKTMVKEELGGTSYLLNSVHGTNIEPALLCLPTDRSGLVYKVYWPEVVLKDEDLKRTRLLLETLASSNFYFHSIDPKFKTDKSGIAFVDVPEDSRIVRQVPPFVFDGKTVEKKFFAAFVPALHLAGLDPDVTAYKELCALCRSDNPIMMVDQFTSISLRTKSNGGGLYIEFAGIPETEAEFDAKFAGFPDISKRIGSNNRSVMWARRLNERTAAFEWYPTVGVNPQLGLGLVLKTKDHAERQAGADVHPIYNLFVDKHVATEAFGMAPNGHWKFGLFGANGKRTDKAPGNVALDDSYGHPAVEIETGHSCFNCHSPHDMIQPVKNHLLAMANAKIPVEGWDKLTLKKKFRILGIVADKNKPGSLEDLLDQAAGLYSGEPAYVLAQVKLTHANAVVKSTAGIFGLNPVQKASGMMMTQYKRYEKAKLTPRVVCRELGIICTTELEAQEVLRQVGMNLHPTTFGYSPETPALWGWMVWDGVDMQALPSRQLFETEYAVLMTRVANMRRTGKLDLTKITLPHEREIVDPAFDPTLQLAP